MTIYEDLWGCLRFGIWYGHIAWDEAEKDSLEAARESLEDLQAGAKWVWLAPSRTQLPV